MKQIDRSAIDWTGPTWNGWQGCRKISQGCKFCYMFRDKKRYGQDPTHVHRSSDATFNKPLKWQREVESGERTGRDRLVFTCSWSDWFIEEADPWRAEAWEIVRKTPGLIYQVLTKRAHRIADHLPAFWNQIRSRVWLGVSVEDQENANERIPHLLRVPADVRFLSCEPLLGPLEFSDVSGRADAVHQLGKRALAGIHWLIIGGESGDPRREMDPAWAESIADQCEAAGTPVFTKQDSGPKAGKQGRLSDRLWALKQFPALTESTR